MFTKLFVFVLAFVILPFSAALGEDSTKAARPPADPITPKARAIAGEMRRTLAADSEAIAMLDAIIQGSTLGGDDGWFPLAKAESRFDWEHVVATYDTDSDQRISRREFDGAEADFARLDRLNDRTLTAKDFDWSEHSLTPSPGSVMFFMGDRDANGKVTREEFAAIFDQIADTDSNYLSLDELRPQFQLPPRQAREHRADRPTRSTLIVALQRQELGSLQAGPDVGDAAPDFTLKNLQGRSVTLSEEIGNQPIVLIFGNFTCGPFRSQSGNIEKLRRRYRGRAKFFLVYVREAHPRDGWWMSSNMRVGIDFVQPTKQVDRRTIAQKCQAHLNLEVPFLVDDIDDQVGSQYSGMPNRLYLIDQEGKIVFKSGRGPFGFHPRQLEQSLVLLLNDRKRSDQ